MISPTCLAVRRADGRGAPTDVPSILGCRCADRLASFVRDEDNGAAPRVVSTGTYYTKWAFFSKLHFVLFAKCYLMY